MRPACVAASRAAEVRRAARAWERAGVIDGPTRAAIDAAYPSDGHAHATAWRVVIFVITTVATLAAFAAFAGVLRAEGAAIWLFFGVILAAATEALDRSSLKGNGAAGATSFWAVASISVGFALLADTGRNGAMGIMLEIAMMVATVALALACWRWGIEIYGAFAAAAFFLLLAQFPGGRLTWVAAAMLILPGAFRLFGRAEFVPEHRVAVGGVFAIAALALYAAVNRFSVDRLAVDYLRVAPTEPFGRPTAPLLQTGSAIATALVPIVFLVWGLRTRRRLVLDLGLLFAVLSLMTLRYYVHLAPLWEILCASGAALLVLALAVNRKLRRSEDGEWGGFTAHSLYSGMGALPAAAVVAGFAPDVRLAQRPDGSNFTSGGGTSGGGGATGSF